MGNKNGTPPWSKSYYFLVIYGYIRIIDAKKWKKKGWYNSKLREIVDPPFPELSEINCNFKADRKVAAIYSRQLKSSWNLKQL